MRTINRGIVAGVLAVGMLVSTPLLASTLEFQGGLNTIQFSNRESAFTANGVMKSPTAGDWTTARPLPTDYVVGIFRVDNITAPGFEATLADAPPFLTGIFAFAVESIIIPPAPTDPAGVARVNFRGLTDVEIAGVTFTDSSTSFSLAGNLGSGEVVRMFQKNTNLTVNGTLADSFNSAIGGSVYASFGLGAGDGNGPGYSFAMEQTASTGELRAEQYTAMNIIINNTGFPGFVPLNNPNAGIDGLTTFTTAWLESQVRDNQQYSGVGGTQPWTLLSADPGQIHPIPLPAAVWAGLALIGMVGVKQFRRNRQA